MTPPIIKMMLAGCCLILSMACHRVVSTGESGADHPAGSLFIIGGGNRPPEMIRDLCDLALEDTAGTIFVFPHASAEPDTSFFYAALQFRAQGYARVCNVFPGVDKEVRTTLLDSVRVGRLIYLAGGDQTRFMEQVSGTPLQEALQDAFENGAVIAGTSAGAAVMSKIMITGDQQKYPEYTGDFRTIEADNMILSEGLGLLTSAVIDQHFIRRMRMNRLLSVVLEHPGLTGIGIDESTALHVQGREGTVYGTGQVMVFRTVADAVRTDNGLLGARNIRLDLLLPGDTIHW